MEQWTMTLMATLINQRVLPAVHWVMKHLLFTLVDFQFLEGFQTCLKTPMSSFLAGQRYNFFCCKKQAAETSMDSKSPPLLGRWKLVVVVVVSNIFKQLGNGFQAWSKSGDKLLREGRHVQKIRGIVQKVEQHRKKTL